jgi:hypothetical protein
MAVRQLKSIGARLSNSTWDNDLLAKSVSGVLLGFYGSNKGSDQYVMLFDSAASVSNGTAPSIHPIFISGADNFFMEVPVRGMHFTNGLYIANSTTDTTLTLGSADCWFTVVMI